MCLYGKIKLFIVFPKKLSNSCFARFLILCATMEATAEEIVYVCGERGGGGGGGGGGGCRTSQ